MSLISLLAATMPTAFACDVTLAGPSTLDMVVGTNVGATHAPPELEPTADSVCTIVAVPADGSRDVRHTKYAPPD